MKNGVICTVEYDFLYMQFRINAESVSNYTKLKSVCAYGYNDYKSEKKIVGGGATLLWN